jgi:hypothetical protein
MPRLLLIAVLAPLYVAFAVWLVWQEGVSYRRSLREEREKVLALEAPPPKVEEKAPEHDPVPRPPEPPAPDARVAEAAKAQPPEPVKPAEEPTKAAEPPPVAVAEPAPPVPPPLKEPPRPEPKPAPPAKIVETLNLSPEEERELGREVHERVLAGHKALDSGPWLRRVTEAARPLIAACSRRDVEYQFTVLDSDDVNAFSHLGGYIYVSRGLFDLIAGDEELLFVLGHEIAHVDLKHGRKPLDQQRGELERLGVGTAQAVCHEIAAGYPEAEEYAADLWALRQLIRLGHSRRECLSFLRKFVGYSENHGFENGRKPPRTGLAADVQEVENHFRTQPAAWARLDRLKGAFDSVSARPASPR